METIKNLQQALNNLPTSITRPEFDDVELTPAETAEALYQARAKKWGILNEEKIQAERLAKYNAAIRPWDISEMWYVFHTRASMLVSKKGHDQFLIEDSNRVLIEDLCNYFANTPCQYSPQKGMFIMGGVGTGKTTIMDGFSRNKKMCYKVISAIDMAQYVKDNGADSWKIFMRGSESPGLETNFYQQYCGWLIDDLGTEEVVNDFGNKLDVVANIVFAATGDNTGRYAGCFHFTTNLNREMLEARYGQRVMSRLREMCNVVSLTGNDRRK